MICIQFPKKILNRNTYLLYIYKYIYAYIYDQNMNKILKKNVFSNLVSLLKNIPKPYYTCKTNRFDVLRLQPKT